MPDIWTKMRPNSGFLDKYAAEFRILDKYAAEFRFFGQICGRKSGIKHSISRISGQYNHTQMLKVPADLHHRGSGTHYPREVRSSGRVSGRLREKESYKNEEKITKERKEKRIESIFSSMYFLYIYE